MGKIEGSPFLSMHSQSDGKPSAQLTYKNPEEALSRVRLPATGKEVIVLTDREAVVKALSSSDFSVRIDPNFATSGTAFRSDLDPGKLDPPKATEIRRPLGIALSEKALTKHAPEVKASALKAVKKFGTEPSPSDVITGYCEPLIADLTTSTLGVKKDEWPHIQQLANTTLGAVNHAGDKERITPAWEELYTYCDTLAADKRNKPDGSVFSDIVASLDRGKLTEEQVSHTAGAVLIGLPSALPVLSVSIAELLNRPETVKACIENQSLWLSTINEVVRYKAHFSLASPRVATKDVDLGNDRLIKKGEVVIPSLTAGAHDKARMKKPNEFDIYQTAPRSIVFGAGAHFCPGAAMSRQWLVSGISTLFSEKPNLQLAIPKESLNWQNGLLSVPKELPVM